MFVQQLERSLEYQRRTCATQEYAETSDLVDKLAAIKGSGSFTPHITLTGFDAESLEAAEAVSARILSELHTFDAVFGQVTNTDARYMYGTPAVRAMVVCWLVGLELSLHPVCIAKTPVSFSVVYVYYVQVCFCVDRPRM